MKVRLPKIKEKVTMFFKDVLATVCPTLSPSVSGYFRCFLVAIYTVGSRDFVGYLVACKSLMLSDSLRLAISEA